MQTCSRSDINEYLDFPHVRQVFRIERTVTRRKRSSADEHHHEVVYGITSVGSDRADAVRIGVLARGHWEIENRLHWVRDVTFDEDRSQVRTKGGPQAFACLRNFAISCLRLAGCANIAAGLRHGAWNWRFAFQLLRI